MAFMHGGFYRQAGKGIGTMRMMFCVEKGRRKGSLHVSL
jgi:hypothetical protein